MIMMHCCVNRPAGGYNVVKVKYLCIFLHKKQTKQKSVSLKQYLYQFSWYFVYLCTYVSFMYQCKSRHMNG